jgi:tetratricopeptide (TPR) repeat protein
MIITGNSNVDCLRRFGRPTAASGEPVRVHWVGALHLGHFARQLPIAEKVFHLFTVEQGWKLLALGTHDVYRLWRAAAAGQLEATLSAVLAGYGSVLSALAGRGKVGWLVFPDPLRGLTLPGLGDAEKIAIARRFVVGMSTLCAERGVTVVDAVDALAGPGGGADPRFLQEDGLHLNELGTRVYLARVSAVTGMTLTFEPRPALFSPRSEDESFYGLVLGNLGVPERRLPPRAEFEAAVCGCVSQRLRERGLDLDVVATTELVGSGLLDSLDLVETWDFAASAIDLDVPFNVDLRELGTVEKLAGFLLARAAGRLADSPGPVQTDFVESIRGGDASGDALERVRAAEAAIAAMTDATLASLEENVVVASEGMVCPYGLAQLWVALACAARGEEARALRLLDEAESPQRRYPVPAARVRPYRERWQAVHAAPTWERPVSPDVLTRRGAAQAGRLAELQRAEALATEGRIQEALVGLHRLLAACPTDAGVLAAVGKICLALGQDGDARLFFERAAASSPCDAAIAALPERVTR